VELAEAMLVSASQPIRCGLGLLPDHAGSAGELFEITLDAMRRATEQTPLQLAPARAPLSFRLCRGLDLRE
jgi:hypothetical protein